MRIAILLSLLLAACATFDEQMAPTRNSWQGVRYEEVIKRWGAPVRSSGETHTWVSEGGGRAGSSSVGIFGGSGGGGMGVGMGVGFGSGGGTAAARCERILTFRDGVVSEQSWIGPADYCKTFLR